MDAFLRTMIQPHEQTGPKICGRQNDHIGIALNISTGHTVRRRSGREFDVIRPRFGMMNLLPPTTESEIEVDGRSKVILVAIAWSDFVAALNATHDVDASKVELLIRHHAEDSELTRLIVAAACRGPRALEAAVPLLAGQLLTRHSNCATPAKAPRNGGFSPPKLRDLLDRIERDIDAPLLLHQLAASVNLSMFHFAREFSRVMGIPPHSYIIRRRLHRALEAIATGGSSSAAAAVAAGFVDTSHFARHFRKQFGVPLRDYRRGAFLH